VKVRYYVPGCPPNAEALLYMALPPALADAAKQDSAPATMSVIAELDYDDTPRQTCLNDQTRWPLTET